MMLVRETVSAEWAYVNTEHDTTTRMRLFKRANQVIQRVRLDKKKVYVANQNTQNINKKKNTLKKKYDP